MTPDEDVPDGPDDDGPDDGPDEAPAGGEAAAEPGPDGQRRRRRRRRRRRHGEAGDAARADAPRGDGTPGDAATNDRGAREPRAHGPRDAAPGERERRDYQRTHGARDDQPRVADGERAVESAPAGDEPRAAGGDPERPDGPRDDRGPRDDGPRRERRRRGERGREARGPDNRGPDNRGPDNRGSDNRGGQRDNRGPDNRDASGGQRDNRGPDNRDARGQRDRRGDGDRNQRGPRHRDDGTPSSIDAPTVRLEPTTNSDGPTVRLDPRRPMAPPAVDDLDVEGPTAPAIPWGKDDDGPPPAVTLAADLPADAPDDDPDPVTWPLLDIPAAPLGDDVASVVGVRFVPGGRIQWCDAGDADYATGERVLVDAERGSRLAWVAVAPSRRPVRDRGLRRVIRRANDHDLRGERDSDSDRIAALRIAKDKAAALRLPLKVFRIDLNGQLGRNARLNIYYTCDERLDLRELIREVSQATGNSRIELRQLGVRDEAKAVGGIGSCGLTLCCTTWLPDFVPVSIKMAKDQGLVLSPTKVSGQCGRLKCCLVYEQAGYAELRKGLPKLGKRVIGARGEGRVVEVDVLRQRVRVSYGPGDTEVVPASEVRPMFPSGNQPAQHRGTPSDPAIDVPDEAEDPGDSLEMPAAVDGTAPDPADALADDDPSNAT